jgi:ketosteroid isomerase-like protein
MNRAQPKLDSAGKDKMTQATHALVERFLETIFSASLREEMFTPDLTVWSIYTLREEGWESLQATNKLANSLFPEGFRYRVKAITAEADRALAEVEAEGTLENGVGYRSDYVFAFRIRDGRIARMEEFFDVREVDKIFALLAAKASGNSL